MSTIFILILILCSSIPGIAVARVILDSVFFHPENSSSWIKGLPESNSPTTVYAVRIDKRGEAYPRHLQFREKGQAIWYGKTYYRLEILNNTWTIELQPYYQFPHLLNSSSSNSTRTIMGAGCYYRGRILGELSLVKVNLCEGMTGDIHTSFGEYVIHPLISMSNESSFIPHQMSFLQNPDFSQPWRPLKSDALEFCDVKDDIFNHEKQEQLMNLKSTYLNSSNILSRKRRSESRELHLEVLVVADRKMSAYHGSNLNHYILTLMSTVALIYKDSSIGNNINIAVVDIVVLNETADHEVIHHIAPITLRKFCRWQQRNNKLDDRDPAHYDTAILITREDLCRYPGACDTLGLAQSGMVCDSYSSCAIVEDNGLSAAFTIAHELGHVMSIPHDDDNKCARYHSEKKNLHVMARMLDYNSNPWSWSDCSREYLTTFFDVGYGNCLMDQPGRNRLVQDDEFQQSPGQLYPRDRQCELVFGPRSRICPYMPECKRLWCTMEDSTQGGCRTQHMPWADGTECGESKRCHQGECIRYRPSGIKPIDGQWGKWKPYGKCSRTCGGGIQQAFRECNSPKPANGGRYCTGIRVKYKSCNTEDCPTGSVDFRAEQCAEFNRRDLHIPGVPVSSEWVPQHNTLTPHEKCKLYCKVPGSASYYILKEKVIDGTPCELGGFDICVNGNCEPAGCDHILHSRKALDRCGVCGGNNNTCKEIQGHFNKKVDYGYHNILLIPTGASNLMIMQNSLDGNVDDNYIALKDPDETYLLNGEFMVTMFPKKFQYHGITIDYSGSNTVTEYVNSSQALPKDLFLQVLVVGKLQPPNISFSYTVPLSQTKLYTWKLATHYSECTRMCNGVSTLKPVCVRLSDQHPVNDNHCAQLNKPNSPKVRKCNEHCHLKWQDVSKSECSARCGSGVRQKIIKCMKEDLTTEIAHVVPEEHCEHLGPKPSLQEKCWGTCNSTWIYTEWSECSVTCGNGVQHRSAECRNNKNRKEPDSHCNPSTKKLSQACEKRACPNWGVDEWTECSVTCGVGYRQRLLWCKQGDKYVDERYCTEEKPVTKEVCLPGDCYEWIHKEWGPCSATCGDGYTRRRVYCGSIDSEVDDFYCKDSPRPRSMRNCSSGISCAYPGVPTKRRGHEDRAPSPRILSDTNAISEFSRAVWKQGDWSQCSVTCGEGVRRRTITCHNSDDDSRLSLNHCDHRTEPTSTEKCIEKPCPHWVVGRWSDCSVSCGQGTRYRTVHCVYSDAEMQTEESCTLQTKPEVEEICMVQACLLPEKEYRWLNGPWSECSASCGQGTQLRTVHCLDNDGHQASSEKCPSPAPPTSQICTLAICPAWQWSEWSQCPNSCGFHEQMRYPHCVRGERMVPDEDCSEAKPSPENRRCKIPVQCSFRWRKGTWSQCYASCGPTYKVREVVCIDNERNRVADSFCSSKRAPKSRKKCVLKPCPYAWKTSDWSECSKTCDEGIKKRNVSCHAVNAYGWMHPESVDSRFCDSSRRPREMDRCNYGDCSSGFIWRPEPWQHCEGHCENAKQTRKLRCYTLEGIRVPNNKCNKSMKPKKRRKCLSSHECPPKSCLDIQNFQNKREDGDYQIQIRGKMVSVFCYQMETVHPQEYVNLPENNFAIIYSSSLSNEFSGSEECLKNNVVYTCDCNRRDTGHTVFFKVALNVTSLRIIIDDFTFTNTYYGNSVPYGTAGDCLRNPACLHGLFSISFKGTDFRVASKTNWVSKGRRGHATIKRSHDDQIVSGRCGGFCDTCTPDSEHGFSVDVRMPV
uniref:Putative disintegrin and metalloproteinase with thrombospondin motifs n=1 Tax=Cupiennius salei TaxID=6928 RepID=T1DG09_CUPSA